MKAGRKVVDETTRIRCKRGIGILHEEVWQEDGSGEIVKYNLAFINHLVFGGDNDRVLGYDNAHGYHERHFMGTVERYSFSTYEALTEKFLLEE